MLKRSVADPGGRKKAPLNPYTHPIPTPIPIPTLKTGEKTVFLIIRESCKSWCSFHILQGPGAPDPSQLLSFWIRLLMCIVYRGVSGGTDITPAGKHITISKSPKVDKLGNTFNLIESFLQQVRRVLGQDFANEDPLIFLYPLPQQITTTSQIEVSNTILDSRFKLALFEIYISLLYAFSLFQ